jgi:hypothetical protein
MAKKRANEAKRRAAALALAVGHTQQEAADKVGVSERCVQLWLREADFRGAVKDTRDELFDAALGVLMMGYRTAAATVVRLASSKDDNLALRASRTALEIGHALTAFRDHGEKLEELEAAVKELSKQLEDRTR